MDRIYDQENVRQALSLLNQIEVRGFENAKRLAIAAQILNNPKEEKDGTIQEP